MENTNIIRRIDDLGRVVIPKEIRRKMKIKDGDPLEIWLHDDYVCFKKYNPSDIYADQLKQISHEMFNDNNICCTDALNKLEEVIQLLKKDKEE